jgi:hypothetical protein
MSRAVRLDCGGPARSSPALGHAVLAVHHGVTSGAQVYNQLLLHLCQGTA